MRSHRQRLEDIREAIAAVQRHPVSRREAFDSDELLRFFLLKHVEIIGEAAWKLPAAVKDANPSVPWSKIERCRHVLVHDYFDVDWEILWKIVTEHLEPLQEQIEQMLRDA